MRGFPIVSLGAIIADSDEIIDSIPLANIVIPNWEVNEYHNGDATIAKNKYVGNNGYYKETYINSIQIANSKYDNVDLIDAEMTQIISYSYGFLFDKLDFYLNNYYSNEKKLESMQIFRVDSFYVNSIKYRFLWEQQGSGTSLSTFNSCINLPNLISFDRSHKFSISINTKKIYLNVPNLQSFGTYLFDGLLDDVEIIFNLNNFVDDGQKLGYFANGNYIISTTNDEEFTKAETNYMWEIRSIATDNSNFNGTISVGRSNVPLSEFDIRYWDLWQNTTGKDSGLH